MTAIVEKLFNHAVEKNFHPYLSIHEYSCYTRGLEQAETSIQELLPPDQLKLLEDLRQNRIYCSSIEQEAAFQAGLAIGLELSRL